MPQRAYLAIGPGFTIPIRMKLILINIVIYIYIFNIMNNALNDITSRLS